MKLNKYLRPKAAFYLMSALVFAVFYVFVLFDSHLLIVFEKVATRVNGALVDARRIKTNLFRGSVEIYGLSVANPFNPSMNLVEFDRVRSILHVGPLFRGKLVVDEVEFSGARIQVARDSFGGISTGSEEMTSLLDRAAPGFSAQILAQISQSPLRLVGQLERSMELKGGLQGSLATFRRFDELSRDVGALSKLNSNLLSETDSHKAISQLSLRLETLKQNRSPGSVLSDSWSAISRDALITKKPLVLTLDTIRGRFDRVRESISAIEPFVREDVATLKTKMHLPKLDNDDLSPELFVPAIMHSLDRLAYWLDVGRRRMRSGTRTLVKQPNNRGVFIHYGRPGGWPAVLISKIVFAGTPSEFDSITGTITGVTSDPPILGEPCKVKILINSPQSNISNLNIEMTLDHRNLTPEEQLNISLDSIPISGIALNEGSDLKLMLSEATLRGNVKLLFQSDQLSADWDIIVENAKFQVTSRHRKIQETILEAVKGLSRFNLSGKAGGLFSDLQFSVRSELGKTIAEHLRTNFTHSIAAIDETLRNEVLDLAIPKQKSISFELETLEKSVYSELQGQITTLNDIANIAIFNSQSKK